MLIKAHAKINLVLDVLGTRPDGYHELETVMQTLDLGDEIELASAHEISLTVDGADLPAGPENLAYRAASLLRERTGHRGGVLIKLKKRIPLAAGLAGGSADAAAVLQGLNKLWNLNLGIDQLSGLGAEIGSDVPFCIRGGTALCRGRGELVTPLPDLPAAGVLLVKPDFGVSTADVYRRYDTLNRSCHPGCAKMLEAVKRMDMNGVAANLENALEAVTLDTHPELGRIKEQIAAKGAMGVLMSGSGPTIFGIFISPEAAQQAAQLMGNDNRWVLATAFKPSAKE